MVLFVVFEKSFNEFDTKVDVIQLAVGIQLLVQHVGVERDLIEKIGYLKNFLYQTLCRLRSQG